MNFNYRRKLDTVAGLTVLTGVITLSSTIGALAHGHHLRIVVTDAHLTVVAGLSLVYLATLLRRGKYNAWLISLPVYGYLIIRNYQHFFIDVRKEDRLVPAVLNLLLPALTLLLLIIYRKLFNVRSELLSFTLAIRRALLILTVAFLYGVGGFYVMDDSDFHQELNLISSAHYTVDQFNLTTVHQITPYTKRARVFADSLAAVSLASVFYTCVSLFSPVRFKLRSHRQDYEDLVEILKWHSRTSEDFFKLWPTDKAYFFNRQRTACIAYKTAGGVALAVGDPVGGESETKNLCEEFNEFCRTNDWTPAFVHADDHNLQLFSQLGYEYQKIGEEAIIGIPHFMETVAQNKYFRHINNKFIKLGYQYRLLAPPHKPETLHRLQKLSGDWLSAPGRGEHGFMMGYFAEEYLQQCRIATAIGPEGRIEAFINQVPSFVDGEANFDFLRHGLNSPGNINDYLMLNFVKNLHAQDIKILNMGLAPLSGLGKSGSSESALINSFLNFAYANGNRFYSFQGLARFKAKYEPNWQSRYIIYSGGWLGFSKTMNSLMRAMRVKNRRRH